MKIFLLSAVLFLSSIALASFVFQAIGQPQIAWNEAQKELFPADISDNLKTSEFGPVTFPTAEEIRAISTTASQTSIYNCTSWLAKIIAKDWLPSEMGGHLIPLRKWAKANGRDSFVVRYELNGAIIQIIDNRSETTILIKDLTSDKPAPKEGHVDFLKFMAGKFMTLPAPVTILLGKSENCPNLTLGLWDIKEGNPNISIPIPVIYNPIAAINFATDGSTVAFCIAKSYGSATPRPPSMLDKPLFEDEPEAQPMPEPQPQPKTPNPSPPGDNEVN
jgi:hypothetical protein